ncbi:hypothetical protein Pfo_020690, partial [Paulownia fortunei]
NFGTLPAKPSLNPFPLHEKPSTAIRPTQAPVQTFCHTFLRRPPPHKPLPSSQQRERSFCNNRITVAEKGINQRTQEREEERNER